MVCLSLSAHASDEISSTSLCVHNQSDVELFFVLRLNNVSRTTGVLKTDERLCLQGTETGHPGTVAVFESPLAMEGCTRLAKSGQMHILTDYSSFDNCTWQ